MISIDQAWKIIQDHLPEAKVERRDILKCRGLRLARDVNAPEPMPRFSNSAMDGYAIALPDKKELSVIPLRLEIIGESRAGRPFEGELLPGKAVVISTGAQVPEGTNYIIPVEVTSKNRNQVVIHELGKPGAHIRHQGEEIAAGEIIGTRAQKLTPVLITHLVRFGITEVDVFTPPTISIITTGEELVSPDQEPKKGQIRNTNQVFLMQFLNGLSIQPQLIQHIRDNLEDTIKVIEEATIVSDIILISGGVSVGKHDHVKAAAEKVGFERHFWRVAQKPGKPFYFATRRGKCLFGLPGNPLSVVMISLFYLYPSIKILSGEQKIKRPKIQGKFSTTISGITGDRAQFFLVKIDQIKHGIASLTPLGHQQSHMISSAVEADGFILIHGNKKEIHEREIFHVYTFPWGR